MGKILFSFLVSVHFLATVYSTEDTIKAKMKTNEIVSKIREKFETEISHKLKLVCNSKSKEVSLFTNGILYDSLYVTTYSMGDVTCSRTIPTGSYNSEFYCSHDIPGSIGWRIMHRLFEQQERQRCK